MTQQGPTTVEQGEDDFLFVLEPGTYWFTVRSKWWTKYRKILRYAWEDAFRTVSAVDEAVRTEAGRKLLATWVVLEVAEPIMVSATIMGAPHEWAPGDNAQSVGAFDVPEPHWMVGAAAMSAAVQQWAADSIEWIEETAPEAWAGAKEKLGEIFVSPGEWLDKVQSKAGKIALLLVVAGVGALAVYRATRN